MLNPHGHGLTRRRQLGDASEAEARSHLEDAALLHVLSRGRTTARHAAVAPTALPKQPARTMAASPPSAQRCAVAQPCVLVDAVLHGASASSYEGAVTHMADTTSLHALHRRSGQTHQAVLRGSHSSAESCLNLKSEPHRTQKRSQGTACTARGHTLLQVAPSPPSRQSRDRRE